MWSKFGPMNRLLRSLVTLVLCTASPGLQAAVYPLVYHLSSPGTVSVAVYDARGTLVRELLRAAPQSAGDHTLFWDGLDRDAKGVPSGKYGWKLLQTHGLSAQYLLSVGSNYPVGTNLSSSGGPGTHVSPYAVAEDETGIYISALQTENIETGLLKLSPDGKKRLWSQRLPFDARGRDAVWEGARSLAVDHGEVYLLGHRDPQRVHVSSAATGAGLRAFDVSGGSGAPDSGAIEPTQGATDMDIRGGVLVVAYKSQNVIRWYDPATGVLLDSAAVASPSGVAVSPKGAIFVTTGQKIVRVTRADHALVIVKTGLTLPGRLAVDGVSGELLVFQGGASQQVVRVSPTGDVLRTYGLAGGRRDGLYVDRDFDGVTDLAADGKGGFFVAEPSAAPRRVARVSKAGTVIQEWYGGQIWDTHGAFEPGAPEAMWIASAAPNTVRTIMRVVVDYAHKSWRVHSCYKYVSPANPLMHTSGNEGSYFRVYEHGGAKYLALEGAPCIWKIDEKSWRLVPVTSFGGGFQWNDANDDGLVQEAEKTAWKPGTASFRFAHLDANFDSYFIDQSSGACHIRRVRVARWNAEGAPVYGDVPDEAFADCPSRFASGGGVDLRWGAFLHHDTITGNLYGALNPGTTDWCLSGDSFVQQWNAAGHLTWGVGELGPGGTNAAHSYQPTAPGMIYRSLRGLAGVAHGCVVAIDVDGGWLTERAQTYVWDPDGLFVGGVMDKPDLDGIPEFMYHLGGEFAHSSVYTLPDGDVLFAGNWENEVRVYRVSGWDGPSHPWLRSSGELTVASPTPDQTGPGLTAEYFDDEAFSSLRAVKVDGPIDLHGGPVTRPARHVVRSVRWRGSIRPPYGPRYLGHWTQQRDANAADGGYHQADGWGARMEYRFRGRSISIIGLANATGGYADIDLDGARVETSHSCYSATPAYDAVIFRRTGLTAGVHTVTLTATRPHPVAHATYLNVDKVVVDGVTVDDGGIPYTFYAKADAALQLWVGATSVIKREVQGTGATETASAPIKLERRDNPIQLTSSRAAGGARVTLSWSSPSERKRPIPAASLFPVTMSPPM
jgi:hypothetical protein